MATELVNQLGNVYLTLEYDGDNNWLYTSWVGYQTYHNVVNGAHAILQLLQEHACPFLLNDNRAVVGPWDHSVG
jgi:hypothetical protein